MKRFIIIAISVMAALVWSANTASAQFIGADKSLKDGNFSFDKNRPPLDPNADEVWAIYGKQMTDEQLKDLLSDEWNFYLRNRTAWRVGDVIEKGCLISMLIGGACALYICGGSMLGTREVSWDNALEKIAVYSFVGGAACTYCVVMPIKTISNSNMKGVIKRYNKTVKVTKLDLSSTPNGVGLTMSF